MHGLDLASHLHAQRGVEVRQRFVKQEDLRIAHQRASHGYTLALAAGKLARITVQQLVQPQNGGSLVDLGLGFVGAHLLQLQREAHIILHRHVRIKGVVLEDHGDIAVAGGQVAHLTRADVDFAVADFF
ncbi:hypothetical protein D3C78_1632310 [compost metagenome]